MEKGMEELRAGLARVLWLCGGLWLQGMAVSHDPGNSRPLWTLVEAVGPRGHPDTLLQDSRWLRQYTR